MTLQSCCTQNSPASTCMSLYCAVYPAGVLQVEAMAQLGGIVMLDPSAEKQNNNFFFGGVDGVKWRKPVVPGDTLVRVSNA